jgi:nucleoside-diphosphate-sugar epimerase
MRGSRAELRLSMSSLRVLFIGGSGVISSACAREALHAGIDLYVLNRGQSTTRPLPPGVRELRADVRNPASVRDAIKDLDFDSVVDWVAFTPEHVRTDIDLFRGRTGQYVFISSASAYQTPPARLPVTESTPLRNPFWQYSRDKIACEDLLVAEYRAAGFPATIVRPSHTYDQTLVPFEGRWTMLGRMLAGKPVIVHGDGTSLWTMTHNSDFARGFVPLLGHPRTLGEAFQITSDDFLTWDQIARALAGALGVSASLRVVHVPSDAIAGADPDWGAGLLGDKAHSMVFDNSKLRSLVPGWRAVIPFERGAREIADWYLADPARQVTDEKLDALMDKLAASFAVS